MLPDADTLITPEYDLCSEMTWSAHYPRLQSLARRYVYRSYIPTWQGQEEDIIEDIVQETARRIIERTQQIEQRLAVPIYSPFHFIAVGKIITSPLLTHKIASSLSLIRKFVSFFLTHIFARI